MGDFGNLSIYQKISKEREEFLFIYIVPAEVLYRDVDTGSFAYRKRTPDDVGFCRIKRSLVIIAIFRVRSSLNRKILQKVERNNASQPVVDFKGKLFRTFIKNYEPFIYSFCVFLWALFYFIE